MVEVAARAFRCPTAAVALAEEERLLLWPRVGLELNGIGRQGSFSDFVIASGAPLIVKDARKNPRFRASPGVRGEPYIRFYIGYPLRAVDGRCIGVLCVVDTRPRAVAADQMVILQELAALVEGELSRRELLKTQRELEAKERHYRALIEHNPDLVYTIDPSGRFTSANESFTRVTGYGLDEIIGMPFTAVVAPESLDVTAAQFRRCLAGEPQHLQIRVLRKDGSDFYASISASPFIVDGKVEGVAGITRDVTARVQAERALRESEERLSLALESTDQGVWEWDAASGGVRLYGALPARIGLDASLLANTAAGIECRSRIHPQDRAAYLDHIEDVVEGRSDRLNDEYRLACPNGGYRWIQRKGRVLSRGGDGRPLRAIGTLKDIHERKSAEEERLRQAERLRVALSAGGVGIFEWDLVSRRAHWDARTFDLFEQDPAAGMPSVHALARGIHPQDRRRLHEAKRRILGGEPRAEAVVRVTRAEGGLRHVHILLTALRHENGAPRVLIGSCRDVTQSEELQAKLAYHASHDSLTGLLNRFEFERRLSAAQAAAEEEAGERVVCFIDLDRFKMVNDTSGHAAGDALLREVGQLLDQRVRGTDVLARLGGDEFGLLLEGCSLEHAEQRARELIDAVDTIRFPWEGRVHSISASIGIARLGAEAGGVAEVMSQADIACYAAKSAGRRRVAVYSPERSEVKQHHREVLVAASLREALEEERFCLYAQAIVPTAPGGGAEPHYELLVRMIDAGGGLIPPGTFIPAAERYDLMAQIDRWVLREALERLAPRLAAGNISVSLNLSAHSLNDPSFSPFLLGLLAASPLPSRRVRFEITETAVMSQLSLASELMSALRAEGCEVALDDFGSGLSSFSYLRHFPVDYLKIDGSFIRSLRESAVDRAIVESMHGIARRLGARTIAEFVEDETTLALIRELGIDYAQGYGIGKPQPLGEVLAVHGEPLA